jgi:hypothetical protein
VSRIEGIPVNPVEHAGSIGAGDFHTRSFLALIAVLYGVTAALEAIKVSLLFHYPYYS